MNGTISPAEVEAMTKALDEVRKQWLKRPGVTAVDVGFKMKGGKPTDSYAIRVHVRRKLPAEALPPHEIFPDRLGPYGVDVIEAEYGPQPGEGRGE